MVGSYKFAEQVSIYWRRTGNFYLLYICTFFTFVAEELAIFPFFRTPEIRQGKRRVRQGASFLGWRRNLPNQAEASSYSQNHELSLLELPEGPYKLKRMWCRNAPLKSTETLQSSSQAALEGSLTLRGRGSLRKSRQSRNAEKHLLQATCREAIEIPIRKYSVN